MSEPAPVPPPAPRIPWEDPGLSAASGLFRTIGMVIGSPREAFTRVANGEGIGRPFAFGIVLGYVALVAGLVWNVLTRATMMRALSFFAPDVERQLAEAQAASAATATIVLAVLGPFLVAIGMLFTSAVFHLFLMLFGGVTRGFTGTLRVVAYAQACQIFGLVPLCGGVIGVLWGVVAQIVGLDAVHRSGPGKAAAAVLVPGLLCCGCSAIVYGFLVAAVFSIAQ